MSQKPDNKKLREEVHSMCERLGFWNVRPVMVGKELGTAHQNIHRWKKQWIKQQGLVQIEDTAKEIKVNSETLLKELMKLSKDKDKKTRLAAISTFFNSQEKFTHFLENFNYKKKVAEQLEVKENNNYTLADAYREIMFNGQKRGITGDNKKKGCKIPS